MNEQEKAALRANHLAFIEHVNAKDIASLLYQTYMINIEHYEEIMGSKMTRNNLCQSFLLMINKPCSKCTFEGLLQALRYRNAYGSLADQLMVSLPDIKSNGKDNNTCSDVQEISGDNREILFQPVRKVDVFTTTRNKMARLAHELRRFSHDGHAAKLEQITCLIRKRFQKQKLNPNMPVVRRMELADMRFTAIEAEVIEKRVKYDLNLCGSDLFKQMKEVIPFTSSPQVSSMTYLARFGSSIGMSEGIDSGLNFLQFAKQHADDVVPCKDTGMVFYIEVNLLTQKYEASPSDELKFRVLQTTQYAMSQFENETEEVRNDYQRMLMIKMIFCYLGIGLFGRRITKVQTTQHDLEAAKNCLDFIEHPEVWNGLEKRRKMLFLLAKAEYYRQIGSNDLAILLAVESKKLAQENGWNAELRNIETIVKDLEERKPENDMLLEDDGFVENLIDDLTINDSISSEYNNTVDDTDDES